MISNSNKLSISELAQILRSLPKEDLTELLSKIGSQIVPDASGVEKSEIRSLVCPRCKSAHVIKNGQIRSLQRYRCVDWSRTFGDRTGTV